MKAAITRDEGGSGEEPVYDGDSCANKETSRISMFITSSQQAVCGKVVGEGTQEERKQEEEALFSGTLAK